MGENRQLEPGTRRPGRSPAAVSAQRDERNCVLALLLQRLLQADDLTVEIGQLHHPLIRKSTLRRRGDADAA